MKAAVIFQPGERPQYVASFPEPAPPNRNEVILTVKAVAVKHLDKSRASGRHYSAQADLSRATVPGGDGVGALDDGTRVFALGDGMLAEKAIVERDRMIKVPRDLDDATAAALPNAVAGSVAALLFRAGMKKGETVLINGATGFTGKIAVQAAKYYGAGKVIVTGRNEHTLRSLAALGADEMISLRQEDEKILDQLKRCHQDRPVDVILDYLWGRTAELILEALKGRGSFTHRTRFVSIGAVTGDTIRLSAQILRSVDLRLVGSGLGSWTKDEMKKLFRKIVPEMFRLAARNKLKVETEIVALKDIEKLWDLGIPDGKRLVVRIGSD